MTIHALARINERDVSRFRRVVSASRLCVIKKLRDGRLARITSRDERIIEIAVMLIIEIINKIILRHADLSTTQRYLGKVSDHEAIRWIEGLHG